MNTNTSNPIASNGHEYTLGQTKFKFSGGKWHFTANTPDGGSFTSIIKVTGGKTIAERIAKMFDKDVTKCGKIGNLAKANIARLVEARA